VAFSLKDFLSPAGTRFSAVKSTPQPASTAQPKYSYKQRQDGGFDFYNGANKTTIEDYTKNTGANQNSLRTMMAQKGDQQSQGIVAQQSKEQKLTDIRNKEIQNQKDYTNKIKEIYSPMSAAAEIGKATIATGKGLVDSIGNTIAMGGSGLGIIKGKATGDKNYEDAAKQQLQEQFRSSLPGGVYNAAERFVAPLGASIAYNQQYDKITKDPNTSQQQKDQLLSSLTDSVNEQLQPTGVNTNNSNLQNGLIIGSGAAETALNIASAGTPVKGVNGVKSFAPVAGDVIKKGLQSQTLANTGNMATTNLVKQATRNAVPNAVFGASSGLVSSMADPNATPTDYVKNISSGIVGGTALGVASPFLASGAGKAGKVVNDTTNKIKDTAYQNSPAGKAANHPSILGYDDGLKTIAQLHADALASGNKVKARQLANAYQKGSVAKYNEQKALETQFKQESQRGSIQAGLFDPLDASGKINKSAPQVNTELPIVGPNLGTKIPKVAKSKGNSSLGPTQTQISLPNKSAQTQASQDISPSSNPKNQLEANVSSSKPIIPQVVEDVQGILQGQEVKQRGFVNTVKSGEKTPKYVSEMLDGTYIVKSDKSRIAHAKELIRTDSDVAEQLALNPRNDTDITVGNQLLDHYIATGQFDKARNMTNAMAESGTELGRAIHAFADYNKTTPSGAVKFAQKAINKYNRKNPKNTLNLSDSDIKGLVDSARAVQDMPEGNSRNIASQQLMEQVNNLIPSTLADKAIAVWKAGLLTSPRTTMRNIVGNTVHGITETVKDIPAALNDILLSAKTGERTKTFTTRGTISGAKAGLSSSKDMMKFGFDPSQAIDKFDVKHVTWKKTPVQQALKIYTDFVFHSMGAQDQPFYHSSFARSLYDQAGAAAKNAGKSGDRKFIQELIDNPTEQMTINATKDASVAVFRDKNVLRDVAGKFKTTLGKTQTGKIISEVVAPFTGVPSSIAGQLVAYSPIGLAKGVYKDAKVLAKNVPDLQRQASQEIGRGVVGTGILGLGAYLTAQGLMTGNPKDAEESRQWELEGKQANSILINGKWRSINSVGPEALVLLAGSKMAKGDDIGTTAMGIGKDFTNQTFLQGLQQPLNAISDPARYGGTYLPNQAASIIPNVVKDTAKAFDPTQRETYVPGDMGQSIANAFKAGTPGLRNTVTPKRDALGNELKQEPSGTNAFVDLFNSKTPNKSSVVSEMARLYSTGNSVTPSKLTPSQKVLGQDVKLTQSQLDKLEKDTGQPITQQFNQLMETTEYKDASDSVKKKALDNIVTEVRDSAKINIGADNSSNESPSVIDTSKLTSDAQLTLAKDSFDKSGKNYQVVGDTVLRRDAQGAITATPKIKYDYQVNTETMTQQKKNNNLDGWMKTAETQVNSIDEQLKDKSIDPLDKIKLENDRQTILDNAAKYNEYGGFTKASGTKTGKAKKGKYDYTKGLESTYSSESANQTALRNLLKGIKITRKKAKS